MKRFTRFAVAVAMVVATGAIGDVALSGQAAAPPRPVASAQAPKVTSPMQEFGHNIGDDYYLANYQQLMAYWKKLASESPRIKLEEIGKTSEGRPMLMAIITSPANQKNLARYKQISTQLARAEGLTDAQAAALAKEGKAVVWIDGGLHATETLGAQQLLEHVYQMASLNDEETRRFLDDVVQLCVLVNPDGMDLVADPGGDATAPIACPRFPRRRNHPDDQAAPGHRAASGRIEAKPAAFLCDA